MSEVIHRRISIVSAAGFLILFSCLLGGCNTPKESQLISDFRNQLVRGDFGSMYEHSSTFMKGNVTEAEFAARMTIVAETLRKYDPKLEFQRNVEEENRLKQIRRESDPAETNGYTFVLLDIGSPEKVARLDVSWVHDGAEQKLFDLSVGDSPSLNNVINTVAGRPFQSTN